MEEKESLKRDDSLQVSVVKTTEIESTQRYREPVEEHYRNTCAKDELVAHKGKQKNGPKNMKSRSDGQINNSLKDIVLEPPAILKGRLDENTSKISKLVLKENTHVSPNLAQNKNSSNSPGLVLNENTTNLQGLVVNENATNSQSHDFQSNIESNSDISLQYYNVAISEQSHHPFPAEPEYTSRESDAHGDSSNNGNSRRKKEMLTYKLLKFISIFVVEPLALIQFTSMTFSNILGQDLFLYKYCSNSFGYNDSICGDLSAHKNVKDEVYKRTSTLNMYRTIVENTFPIVFALFLGPWSDKYGRKIPLLIGVVANCLQATGLFVNSLFMEWKPELVLLLSAFPYSILGGDLPFQMSLYAFVTDHSKEKFRYPRLAILSAFWYLGYPVGSYFGGWINDVAGFSWVFATAMVMAVFNFLYTLICVRDTKRGSEDEEKRRVKFKWYSFFSINHMKNAVMACIRQRENHGRLIILTLLVSMIFSSTSINGERTVEYVFLQHKFDWGAQEYGVFQGYLTALTTVCLILLAAVLAKVFKWTDPVIALVAAAIGIPGKIMWALTSEPWVYYLGGALVAIRVIVPSGVRAMLTRVAQKQEVGKVFAALASLESLVPLYASVIYTSVFNATLEGLSGSFFLVSVAFELCGFACVLIVFLVGRPKKIFARL